MQKIIIIGPAHPLRGGLATFDQRLAKEFNDLGDSCSIYSFSLQYPGFLFPGKTQYSAEPAPKDLKIFSAINSINPVNWISSRKPVKKRKSRYYCSALLASVYGTCFRNHSPESKKEQAYKNCLHC